MGAFCSCVYYEITPTFLIRLLLVLLFFVVAVVFELASILSPYFIFYLNENVGRYD